MPLSQIHTEVEVLIHPYMTNFVINDRNSAASTFTTEESPYGVVANMLDCDILVNKFELQSYN